MGRAEQREQTRQQIVDAAVRAFAATGYEGTSTRDIAARAGVTQGLVTYYFSSKDELWRAAADELFGQMGDDVPADRPLGGARPKGTARESAREAVRAYVRFSAAHPEVFHFMAEGGKQDEDRMRWLVDTHVRPRYDAVLALAGIVLGGDAEELGVNFYYALVGAASLLFAAAPECAVLTGTDALDPATIERHAELVARLFVP